MSYNDKKLIQNEEELERFQLIYELISEEYTSELTRKKDINEKANQIILFVGILIGLLSSFGLLLLKDISKTNAFYEVYILLFALSLIFLFLSIIGAIYIYSIKEWKTVPNSVRVLDYAKNMKSKLKILQIVSAGKTDAISSNSSKIDKNAKIITYCHVFLSLGLFILLLFIILLFSTNPILT